MRYKLFIFLISVSMSCLPDSDGLEFESLGKWTYYTTKNGLGEDFISAIHEDGEGNIWFGHNTKGLSRYDGSTFTNYNTADGLLSNTINCIFYASDSTLYVGTTNGLNVKPKGEKNWWYHPYFVNGSVSTVAEDSKGVLWIGTVAYGIFNRKDNTITSFYDNQCADCNTVNDIVEASDGKLWFATVGGIKLWDGSTFKLFKPSAYPIPDKVYTFQEDDFGNMWIGGLSKSITRYRNGDFERVSLNNTQSLQFVTAIVKGSPGELWIGTLPNGLIHYDGAVMTKIYKGPPDDIIQSLLKDKRGALWIGTFDKGVARYKLK